MQLGNPVTLGQFEAIGAGPQLAALAMAWINGEEIDPVFLRFLFNQGVLVADEDGGFSISAGSTGFGTTGGSGGGFGGGGGGGGVPRFAGGGLGLTNWRI